MQPKISFAAIKPYLKWNFVATAGVLITIFSLFSFYQSCSRARFANVGGFAFGPLNVTITGFPGGETTGGGEVTGGDTTGGDTTGGGEVTGGDTTGGDTTGGGSTDGGDNYVCGDNLIRNPSFEIVDSRVGLVSSVELNQLGQNGKASSDVYQSLPDENAQTSWFTESGSGIEVKRNSDVTAYHGEHYIELDTQPSILDSSKTNSKMSQVFNVPRTAHYKLTYRFRAQSVDPGDNYVTSDVQEVNAKTVKSQNTPNWRQVVQLLKLNAGTHKISFDAAGTANSAGGFVDDVQLIENCDE